jgi:hypothetical protein
MKKAQLKAEIKILKLKVEILELKINSRSESNGDFDYYVVDKEEFNPCPESQKVADKVYESERLKNIGYIVIYYNNQILQHKIYFNYNNAYVFFNTVDALAIVNLPSNNLTMVKDVFKEKEIKKKVDKFMSKLFNKPFESNII